MKYLSRLLSKDIEKWLERREIIAITGPRQCGKTTLLAMLKDYLIEQKKVQPDRVLYVTFEDRDLLDNFTKHPKEFIRSFTAQSKEEKFYFLIDEFQYVEEGGQKLKLLYDLYENVKFIITGSSSLELKGATAKYLVGRIFYFSLFQFNFEEFLEAKPPQALHSYRETAALARDFILKDKKFEIPAEVFEKDIAGCFEEYVIFGGYPEVIKTDDMDAKRLILKNIYATYISKDIIELLRVEDVSGCRNIIALLANQIGSLLNYNSLATDAKSYFKQIKQYISMLEETFVIRRISPYFTNKATELKKNPKVYFVDTGLRNHIINNFNPCEIRPDAGALVENIVLSQFCSRNYESIRYWRTMGNAEVDFILDINNEIMPFEIKYSLFKFPEITRGFRNFINEYKPRKAIVFTKSFWAELDIGATKVLFIPVMYA